MNPTRRRRAGFTLIEMIIAAILLVVGVAGALGAIGASTRTAAYADQIQTAALLAQRQMAETASQPSTLSAGGDQEGTFDDPYSNYHWKQSVESTDYPNLFKVTVTVTWGTGSHRELTTYLRSDQTTITQQMQQNYQSYQTNQSSSSSGSGGSGGTPTGGSSGP